MRPAERSLFVGTGRVHLAERLGKGGEGEVYALRSDAGSAVKLYTLADPGERSAKIAAMVRRRLGESSPTVAFPRAVVRDDLDRFAGFVMPRVAAARPIHELYGPASRKRHFPQVGFAELVHVALNVAKVVGAVHRAGCVIGDVNHSGFLVCERGLVTLIDADSFQVEDGGRRFLCRVGVPEYTAPELHGASLDGVVRTRDHDAFGLAVLLFQLLAMGRHPHAGRPRAGDLSLPDAIRGHHFAYTTTRRVGLTPPPGAPDLADLGPAVARRFEAAFAPEGVRGRPSAADWVAVLAELQKALLPCAHNSMHRHLGASCPWCRIEGATGAVLFLGPERTVPGPGGDVGLPPFDLARLRARLVALDLPTSFEVALPMPPGSGTTRTRAPGLLGWIAHRFDPSRAARRELVEVDEQIRRVMTRMQDRARLDVVWRAAIAAAEHASERRKMAPHHKGIEQKLSHAFQKDALLAHLDRRFVKHATIQGIGPALVMTMASFGFETAADVKRRDVQAVQGIGPVKAKALGDWVRRQERTFTAPSGPDEATRSRIRAEQAKVAAAAAVLDREIASALEKVRSELGRIEALRAAGDPELQRLAVRRADLAAEIAAHKGAAPRFEPPRAAMIDEGLRSRLRSSMDALRQGRPAATSQSRTAMGRGSTASSLGGRQAASRGGTAPAQGSKTCPKCGSRMVRRKARRGRNAGGFFYGCTTYPRCHGTAPDP